MALETHFTTSITLMVLMTLHYGSALKPTGASTTVSHIPATKISKFEGNGCPGICTCGLSFDRDVLRISDCSEDPKDDLNQVIDSHKDIVRLEIVDSYLTTLPYNLSNLKQLTHLKLQNNMLEIVSKELYSLTHLKSLDLSFNEIDAIPCELSNLTELTFLNFSGNWIESINCGFSDMAKLTTLDLSYNDFNEFDPCQLSTLSHLTTHDLSLNGIQTVFCNPLSCDMSNLSQLSSLDLSSNKIQSVQCDFSNFPSLTYLKLLHNKLSTFPCDLSTLTQVTSLDLSNNEISSVQCNLANLTNLTSLKLFENDLDRFPCELSTLNYLTSLDLSNNKIKSVHCDFSKFGRLTYLNFGYNKLSTFPCDLSTLTQVTSLDFTHNQISSVPCNLSNLTNLIHLNLISNHLNKFPCELSSLNRLSSLDLSENRIRSVQCDVSNLTRLTSLGLSANKLFTFPRKLSTLTSLTTLDLTDNEIPSMQLNLSNLTRLNSFEIAGNNLNTFQCELSILTQLTYLDLSFNMIASVKCDLSNLTQLTSLNLQANDLSTVPSALFTLLSLTSLDLSHNHLTSLPYGLSTLTQLTHLDISRNSLTTVPCAISNLTLLINLNLVGNKIMSLQCDLSHLTHLTYLNLGSNHLSTFPCPLTALTNLEALVISKNRITSVHCNLSNLTCLTGLNLNYNALPIVPSELFALTQLNSLALSQNEIESVPCGMSTLTQLRFLYLDNNHINSVVCDLSNLTKVIEFDLSNNEIYTLDSWPISLTYKGSLKYLGFEYNYISQFTNHARAPASLCIEKMSAISLYRNNIKHFMDIIKGWNLKVSSNEELSECLDLLLDKVEGNPLSCDCIDYGVYKQMQARNVTGYELMCHYPARLRDKDPLKLSLDQFICDISTNCPAGCKCTKSPYYQNITVNCEQFEENLLPKDIPKLPSEEYQYCLDYREGNMSKLSYRPYLSKIGTAKFSHNAISEVSLDAILALQNVSVLHLDDNRLERLPDNITTAQLRNVIDVTLSRNPWVCDCAALSTKKWMTDHEKAITDKHLVKCNSPSLMSNRKMMYTEDNLFCPNENSNYVILAAVFGSCIPIICIILFSIIVMRIRKLIIDKHLAERMMILDETNKEFDVFVSYASEDEDYILDDFIPELENHNFKVCFHRIHFLGGNTIIDNISECINNSKRTLVYFSNFYKDSRFCMYEFKEALNKDVREGTVRLITIKDTDLDVTDLDDSTRAYFEKSTYIEKDVVKFWDNILHSLPKKPADIEDVEMQEL